MGNPAETAVHPGDSLQSAGGPERDSRSTTGVAGLRPKPTGTRRTGSPEESCMDVTLTVWIALTVPTA
ncbi:hypothetical protein, partial [Streptomyces sp. SM12]